MADSRWLMAIGEEPMADGRWLMAQTQEPMADPSTLLRVSPEQGRGTDGVLLMARQRTEGIFSAE